MRLVVKKLEVADLGQLQSLVIEHLDEIESGLTLLDSRLLLGHATIDIVALDAAGTLVLAPVGFTADEDMLLKAVEAYSWCLEYPEAIRRLYPSVEISAARPPRLMFVVERMPDAFHRKIKQLGFSEIDCVEFRHLDVSGTPTAYFDTIARLRRSTGLAVPAPEPTIRRAAEVVRRAEPIVAERVAERPENVVPLGAPIAARATSVRLQKMLNTNGNGSSHGTAAPVIEIAPRVATVAAPRVERPRAEATPVLIETDGESAAARPEPAHVETPAPRAEAPRIETPAPRIEVVEAPRVAAPAPAVVETPGVVRPETIIEPVARVALREAVAAPTVAAEPRVSFAEIAKELLGSAPVQPARAEAPTVIPRPPVEEITRAALEEIAAAAADGIVEEKSTIAVEEPPAEMELEQALAALIAEPTVDAVAAPAVEEQTAAAPEIVVAAQAPASAVAAPVPAPVAAAPAKPMTQPAAAPAPEPAAASLPQEFNGLKFPNDGVLTRQWMEFLNQMAATK